MQLQDFTQVVSFARLGISFVMATDFEYLVLEDEEGEQALREQELDHAGSNPSLALPIVHVTPQVSTSVPDWMTSEDLNVQRTWMTSEDLNPKTFSIALKSGATFGCSLKVFSPAASSALRFLSWRKNLS